MNIHLITNLTGFPNGTAAAKRIKMIAKAILETGNTFQVYSNAVSDTALNTQSEGVHDKIPYKYLHGNMNTKRNKAHKLYLYIKGVFVLNRILKKLNKKEDIIYIYAHGNIFNVITILISKLHRLKVVEEINEWDHKDIKKPLKKTISEGPMVKWADGAIVISSSIQNTVISINPKLKTTVIPVLESPSSKKENNFSPLFSSKYCFWMGLVNAYLNDLLLIIEAAGRAYKNGIHFHLIFSGPYNSHSEKIIFNKAGQCGYPKEMIILLGYVQEDKLENYCANATFYIIPLWENEKSLYRFPTKMASFMLYEKPVITCKIGDVGQLLTNKENTLFFKPGCSTDLAEKIELLLGNSDIYQRICTGSRKIAASDFNYETYKTPLHTFFSELIKN